MEWQTKITTESLQPPFSYATRFLFAGSCFAQEMAQQMRELHFQVAEDAFGPLFNPASIASALERLENPGFFTSEDVMQFPYEAFGSLSHHTSFSRENPEAFLDHANVCLKKAADFFKAAGIVIITLGTAWVYKYNGGVVANCHKMPARLFDRVFLEPLDIFEMLAPVIERNRDKTWIMTVSPIRHLADGAHGNQLSKASLHLAIKRLQERFSGIWYFPSYELIMDELRDYRFYATDRCHLTQEAIAYIRERFLEAAADQETMALVREMEKLNTSLAHKPLFPRSGSYEKFIKNLDKQRAELLQTIGNKIKKC
ncbi:MAG: GSCFA domain-containing protein [Bacteroidales bacterium]